MKRGLTGKKGLSAVVTTIIIIALALVAVGIVWVVISNLLDQGTEGITFDRFTVDLSITSAYIQDSEINRIKYINHAVCLLSVLLIIALNLPFHKLL